MGSAIHRMESVFALEDITERRANIEIAHQNVSSMAYATQQLEFVNVHKIGLGVLAWKQITNAPITALEFMDIVMLPLGCVLVSLPGHFPIAFTLNVT